MHNPRARPHLAVMRGAPRARPIGACRFICAAACVLMSGSVHAASASVKVPDTITERVAPCVTCHGKEGRATSEGYFPRIAGKPAGYLYNQLVNFRDARRNYPLMTYLVEHLTDEYLYEIAGHFAGLDLPYPPPEKADAPPELLSRGEALVRRGDAGRKLPACVQCHGEALMGANPAIPGLLGLPRAYLQAQLGHWTTGVRRAREPDCMARVAALLKPEEIVAVSLWLSSQRIPAGAKPTVSPAGPLPIPCGGTK